MQFVISRGIVLTALLTLAWNGTADETRGRFFPELQRSLNGRTLEFDQIPAERKESLRRLALAVQTANREGKPVRLVFICTHNSRRSHFAQLAAAAAARYYGVANVETFSGGTEATAFNPRAVAAVKRAGFQIDDVEAGKNPRYPVRINGVDQALICFSKTYSDPANPKEDFIAVMTCAEADKNCPLVTGAKSRIALPYDDPKASDGTAEESATYDARFSQIQRELLYAFFIIRPMPQ